MDKTEFLQEISSMTREEIDEYFKRSRTRTKILYPLIILEPSKNDSKDKSITNDKTNDKEG